MFFLRHTVSVLSCKKLTLLVFWHDNVWCRVYIFRPKLTNLAARLLCDRLYKFTVAFMQLFPIFAELHKATSNSVGDPDIV